MKRKQFIGFLIVISCLLILLVVMFVGGYVIYESQKSNSESKTFNSPSYYTQNTNKIEIETHKIDEKELLPDLSLDGFYPEKLNDGDGNVVMKVIIRNVGDVEANNVEWIIIGTSDYSTDVDDSVDYLLNKINNGNEPYVDVSHNNPIKSLNPSVYYKINYKFNPDECPVTIGFFLDPENKIKEKDENNNLKSVEIKGCGEEYTSEDTDLLQKKMKKVILYK